LLVRFPLWTASRIGMHGGVTVRVSNAVDLVFAYAHVFQETLIVQPPPHLGRNDAYAIFESTDVLSGLSGTTEPTLGSMRAMLSALRGVAWRSARVGSRGCCS